MKRLEQFLNDTNKKQFLDIGTGAGNFIGFIDELYSDYDSMIGIDVDSSIIEAMNKKNENKKIEFRVMDGARMTFKDNSFDMVCLSNSLHHLEHPTIILNEMRRVLKKDGFILINEMVNNDLDAMQLSHLKLHHFSAKIDRALGLIHFETFHKNQIMDLLQKDTDLIIYDAWELDVPRRESNSDEEKEYIANLIDRVMKRCPESHLEELSKEGEEIKQYIQENGYDGCTSLMVLLTK